MTICDAIPPGPWIIVILRCIVIGCMPYHLDDTHLREYIYYIICILFLYPFIYYNKYSNMYVMITGFSYCYDSVEFGRTGLLQLLIEMLHLLPLLFQELLWTDTKIELPQWSVTSS